MHKVATTLLLVAAGLALTGAIATRSRVGHPVTDRMRSAAGAASGRTAGPRPTGVSAWEKTTVLVFIKPGCPCSEAAEPCFRRLFTTYGDRVAMVGVLEGRPDDADRWVVEHDTPYPVVADPARQLIRAYGAERSAYTALIARGGTIAELWPGYSAPMLRDLGAHLARLERIDERPLDVHEAPAELTSGCPFAL